MDNIIYLDNAATTQIDEDAYKAMIPWLTTFYGNASQKYFFGQKAHKAIETAREKIAKCINANPNEIYYTSGGTESDNWALKGIALKSNLNKNIVVSNIEHHAILNSCNFLKQLNYKVLYADVDSCGTINTNSLLKVLNDKTCLTSIMFANNEIGTIEPIKELCKEAHDKGSLFHTDAVQALGHVPIDVKDLNIDMLSASSHKFNGPKGVGFLYIKDGVDILPFNNGGAQEKNMRAGTENVASIVAMSVALENNIKGLNNNRKHILELENYLIGFLKDKNVDFIRNGSNNTLPGVISLSFKNQDGESIMHRLDLKKICISTGAACDSINTQVSHVLNAIHAPSDYIKGTIRISIGKNNTLDEIKRLSIELLKIVQ